MNLLLNTKFELMEGHPHDGKFYCLRPWLFNMDLTRRSGSPYPAGDLYAPKSFRSVNPVDWSAETPQPSTEHNNLPHICRQRAHYKGACGHKSSKYVWKSLPELLNRQNRFVGCRERMYPVHIRDVLLHHDLMKLLELAALPASLA